MKEIMMGLRYVFSSFGYIRRNKMGYVYLISLAVVIVFMLANATLSNIVSDYIEGLVDGWLMGSSMPGWLNSLISATATIATMVISFIVIATLGGSVIMILLSPLFSHIAEKVFKIETGKSVESGFGVFMSQILRGVGISLRNMVVQYALIIMLLILSFIPAVGWVSNIFIFLVNAFFYGFTLADYAFEVRMFNIKQSAQFGNGNKLLFIGLGLPFSLCMFVPYIGAYIAAFVVPVTVVGATRLLCKQ